MKLKIITTCSVLMAVLGFLGMETGLIISGFRVNTGIGFLSIFIVLVMKKMNPFEKALEAIIGFYDGSYDVEKKYDKEGILHVNVKCGGITIPYWIVYNLSTYFEKEEEKQGLKVNSSLTEKNVS